jgi:hypothetical protein
MTLHTLKILLRIRQGRVCRKKLCRVDCINFKPDGTKYTNTTVASRKKQKAFLVSAIFACIEHGAND